MDFSQHAKALLKDYYQQECDNTPLETLQRASFFYTKNKDLGQRIFEYVQKRWFMFSSPVLSNAGSKSLPISCFLNYVPDSIEGLVAHTAETRWMSVLGGGVGGHWSHVRSASKKSPGAIPFLKTIDSDVQAYAQSATRKGSYAAYLDISHPDVIEFLAMRLPTGGDPNRKCFNIHNALNITDEFMDCVFNNRLWELKDPHSNEVKETIPARELWQRILETRFRTGEPYLHFIDTSNRHLAQPLKDKGLRINGSNLCSEIFIPTSDERSAVCCLSSLNLEFFDEWKDTTIVEDLIEFLDDVLQYFIDHAPPALARAIHSAQQERSLGLGAMGFHSYLQRKMIAFESALAVSVNRNIFSLIKSKATQASMRLAQEKGEYLDGIGSGLRNSVLLAIAPNANSAILLDTSPSIEPWKSNAFTHRTRAGSFLQTNPYLVQLLNTKNIDIDSALQSVILNQGSVQHLDCLTDYEKAIFKTAFELDQMWLIEHAATRQEWICQGQSLNLFFPTNTDINYVNQVHLAAFKKGLKSVYYLRTSAGVTAKVSQTTPTQPINLNECVACQG